jgi:hypothetical protein
MSEGGAQNAENQIDIQTNKQLLKCKRDYYSNKIAEISNNQKQLHRITSDLIGNKREVVLPSAVRRYTTQY